MTIEFRYRIISEPSWQVQTMHDGYWITAWYCASEEAAVKRLHVQLDRAIEWAKMTNEERRKAVLR